jgi:hypothetical protein
MIAGGIALAAWRTPVAFDDWKGWQESRGSDPSAAELYEVDFWFEMGLISVGLISVVGGIIVARQ